MEPESGERKLSLPKLTLTPSTRRSQMHSPRPEIRQMMLKPQDGNYLSVNLESYLQGGNGASDKTKAHMPQIGGVNVTAVKTNPQNFRAKDSNVSENTVTFDMKRQTKQTENLQAATKVTMETVATQSEKKKQKDERGCGDDFTSEIILELREVAKAKKRRLKRRERVMDIGFPVDQEKGDMAHLESFDDFFDQDIPTGLSALAVVETMGLREAAKNIFAEAKEATESGDSQRGRDNISAEGKSISEEGRLSSVSGGSSQDGTVVSVAMEEGGNSRQSASSNGDADTIPEDDWVGKAGSTASSEATGKIGRDTDLNDSSDATRTSTTCRSHSQLSEPSRLEYSHRNIGQRHLGDATVSDSDITHIISKESLQRPLTGETVFVTLETDRISQNMDRVDVRSEGNNPEDMGNAPAMQKDASHSASQTSTGSSSRQRKDDSSEHIERPSVPDTASLEAIRYSESSEEKRENCDILVIQNEDREADNRTESSASVTSASEDYSRQDGSSFRYDEDDDSAKLKSRASTFQSSVHSVQVDGDDLYADDFEEDPETERDGNHQETFQFSPQQAKIGASTDTKKLLPPIKKSAGPPTYVRVPPVAKVNDNSGTTTSSRSTQGKAKAYVHAPAVPKTTKTRDNYARNRQYRATPTGDKRKSIDSVSGVANVRVFSRSSMTSGRPSVSSRATGVPTQIRSSVLYQDGKLYITLRGSADLLPTITKADAEIREETEKCESRDIIPVNMEITFIRDRKPLRLNQRSKQHQTSPYFASDVKAGTFKRSHPMLSKRPYIPAEKDVIQTRALWPPFYTAYSSREAPRKRPQIGDMASRQKNLTEPMVFNGGNTKTFR